jgi:hypothetical protein
VQSQAEWSVAREQMRARLHRDQAG